MRNSQPDCTAYCKGFKCEKQPSALKFLRQGGKKTIWCTWVDDECDGPWCNFALCVDHKMTSDGKCKHTERAVVREKFEDFVEPERRLDDRAYEMYRKSKSDNI